MLYFYNCYLTSVVRERTMTHGHKRRTETRWDKAWRRLAPPTSTDSFREAIWKPTLQHNASTRSSTPPWKHRGIPLAFFESQIPPSKQSDTSLKKINMLSLIYQDKDRIFPLIVIPVKNSNIAYMVIPQHYSQQPNMTWSLKLTIVLTGIQQRMVVNW